MIKTNLFNEAIDALKLDLYDKEYNLFKEAIEQCLLYTGSNEKKVYKYINDNFIYYADQWAIMQYYQTPQDANYLEAEELFTNDLIRILNYITK